MKNLLNSEQKVIKMISKLIEKWFPVKEISRDAGIEMAYKSTPAYIKHVRELGVLGNVRRDFYDPKIRNLHPWFARRPCSAARATILASILPHDIEEDVFMDAIGWNEKKCVYLEKRYPPLIFYTDPKREIISAILQKEGKKPFCISVCDPMAGGGSIPFESLRLGFKTIAIDYNPVAYLILKATIEYPAKYGIKLAERVKEEANSLIKYVQKNLGSFYHNTATGYIFARGIHCPTCGGLIPLIHNSELTARYYVGFHFDKGKKKFTPYISQFKTELKHIKPNEVVCPYCEFRMKKTKAYQIWTNNHLKILYNIFSGILNEEEILSTHILLVRQLQNGYVIADDSDLRAFLDSCKYLSSKFKELHNFLPMGKIPNENEVFKPVMSYGVEYWYQLFNPRQLLSIGLIIKYINDRINKIDLTDEIGKASMLYLTLAASRIIDYNSILTTWKRGTIRDTIGQYARNRSVFYGEAYCEAIVPRKNIRWIFEIENNKKTQGGILPILEEICKRLEGLGEQVSIFHGDARKLSFYINEKLDLINVDPPYFDTHKYSDISEYFWQILRLSLKPLISHIFMTKQINWQPEFLNVPREGELIVRKSKNSKKEDKFDEIWYASQMLEFFKEAYKILKDDGLLVVWFTHKTLNAWKSIISALYGGGFYVTRIWPVTTELLTRLVAKKNDVLDRTLIIVAKKKKDINMDMETYAKKLSFEIVDALKEIGVSKKELQTFLHAAVLSSITVEPLIEGADPINYCYSTLIPKSLEIGNNFIPEVIHNFSIKE
ncbi:MAG: DUF1156 domain-containing protein [candidate division WOR-3 bacterium]